MFFFIHPNESLKRWTKQLLLLILQREESKGTRSGFMTTLVWRATVPFSRKSLVSKGKFCNDSLTSHRPR